MGVFEDFSQFLEDRLDEFLKKNPHLELQALDEQLREQEAETQRLLASFRLRETHIKNEILTTAQEVQRWHGRIEKAKNAKRFDLVTPAEEHEATLLRQGNKLWGQMKGVQDRIQKTLELQQAIQLRRRDVAAKIAQAKAERQASQSQQNTTGWEQAVSSNQGFQSSAYRAAVDPLEASFQQLETEEELKQMKRDMGQ
jgi:uncharacterized protein (TIGR04376 family)